MELEELLDGLAADLGIDGLAVVGGEAALDIDGMPVLIAEAQGDALLASFADTLAEWREALESFRPAAVAAAETKRTDSASPLSPDGFIEP